MNENEMDFQMKLKPKWYILLFAVIIISSYKNYKISYFGLKILIEIHQILIRIYLLMEQWKWECLGGFMINDFVIIFRL